MFDDFNESARAGALPLNTTSSADQAAAARTIARRARDKDDLVLLLDAVGLPGDDDTLITLLPLLTNPEGALDMQQTPAPNAFEATGLSEDEVTALVDAQQRKAAPATTDDTAPQDPAVDASVEQLLAWAEAHPTAGIRNKAARVRGDLSELTARRAADDAQREAEERVATLTAELEKAKEALRAAKAGTHPAPAAATATSTPIRPGIGSGRTREELAAIRAWARANGHQVAGAGMVPKRVLQAYDAAHQAPDRKAS